MSEEILEKINGYMGKIKSKCKICGQEGEYNSYQVKEMYFGSQEEFTYFECDKCHCMQILEIPDNIGNFYGDDYYSFQVSQNSNSQAYPKDETRILDVGCGAGKWLLEKASKGCVNLRGCDPFIEKDIFYEPYIHIKKSTIHEMTGVFDWIRFGDSFEHMADPYEALVSVNRLLDKDGVCVISIPVFPNAAFDIFGNDWYQWDAPRHFFLHSPKSMEYLCGKAGLMIESVIYNSTFKQFACSWLYENGVPYKEHTDEVIAQKLPAEEIEEFKKMASELNEKCYGDHAIFVLRKAS